MSESDVRSYLGQMELVVNYLIRMRRRVPLGVGMIGRHPIWRDRGEGTARPDRNLFTQRTTDPIGFVKRPRMVEVKMLVHEECDETHGEAREERGRFRLGSHSGWDDYSGG